MANRNQVLRNISWLVLVSYLSMVTQPVQAAVQQEIFARPKPGTENSTPMSQLEQMRELGRQFTMQQQDAVKPPQGTVAKLKSLLPVESASIGQERDFATRLLAQRQALQQEGLQQEQQLQTVEQHIKDKKLPAVILQRHQAVLKDLQSRRQQLQASLQQLAVAQQQDKADLRRALLKDVAAKLEKWGGEQAQLTDVKNLPWGSPSSKVRAPLDSKNAYLQRLDLLGVKPLQVAGPLPDDLVWPVLPQLPSAPQPQDTQATEDAQITPAIQAKAAELHHNPAEIYKWVYDHIDYIPTYGSIQGADFTLQSLRGNAFDTSSLLIALLRASNIPARYVYGTIEVPVAQAQNWVGGVNNGEAALQLLGQGGVPSMGLESAGRFSAIRMEHVWVEAYVDFVPSRGVVNRAPDSWIPMDAAYKQNAYTAGMDLQAAVPFDANALITAAQQGATVDEQGGYVQNLNQAAVQSSLTDYQSRMEAYFGQLQDTTVRDVLGTKTIKSYAARGLSSTLQYKVTAVAGDFYSLPDTMRHYFVLQVFQNTLEKQSGQPAFDVKLSTPSLAGQQLALSFNPASAVDEQTIKSYMPQPHKDGSPIQPSELPRTFPGYLIHMTPELTLNGQMLKEGGDFMFGEEVSTRLGYIGPSLNTPSLKIKVIRAGEYYAVGLDLQGMVRKQLDKLQGQITDIKNLIHDGSLSNTAGLTKHHVTGVPLQLGIQYYFSLNDYQDALASKIGGVVLNRAPSFGTFSSHISPVLVYGFPVSASYIGMQMDIDSLLKNAVDKNNNHEMLAGFISSNGARESMNESLIVEALFDGGPEKPVNSICAVKALQLAMLEGQKVYNIKRSNFDEVIRYLNHPALIIEDIRNAVNAGMEVSISQGAITAGGWRGAGYIISDPDTGSAAFLIAGGSDGSESKSYMDFVSTYAITGPEMLATLLFLTVPKSWFGFSPKLGSNNMYTSVIRGLSLFMYKNVGTAIPYAKTLGRFWLMCLIAVFIGFYNVTILIEGFFYTGINKARRSYVV